MKRKNGALNIQIAGVEPDTIYDLESEVSEEYSAKSGKGSTKGPRRLPVSGSRPLAPRRLPVKRS